eukprot:gene8521-10475_t
MKSIKLVILLITIIGLLSLTSVSAGSSKSKKSKSGPIKPDIKSDVLNVHIVAHTHDDVGWLKTVDEYYYGANMTIQFAGVQYTLDSAISSLLQNPNRRFIYVEIAFFERWWNEQTAEMQKIVAQLVHNGQLEFINGGWCMNDEAATYYDDIIDQMTLGHQFLYDNFGVVPRIGWHIDPFGHSNTQATLFGAMGYDAFILGRMDYQDIGFRLENQQMEFVWRASQSNPQYQIFTSVLRAMYCTPGGFNFEQGDDPIQDDPNLFNFNIQERAEEFVAIANEYATHYRTNNVLIPFGCDFAYMNSNMYFKNIDKLINYINSNPQYGMNLLYSTPSIYIDAVNSAGLTWNVKTDDLFPYADNEYSYWTGYFTSRPALKGYVRQNNALLHFVEQMLVTSKSFVPSSQSLVNDIVVMRQAMGVAQHHDAVSGTEQQHVADDYAERLAIGNTATLQALNQVVGQLMVSNPSQSNNPIPNFSFCPLLNESICPSTDPLNQGLSVPMVLYNSLSWSRFDFIRIPVPISDVSVSDNTGVLPAQVTVSSDTGSYVLEFPVVIPPLGYNTYIISPSKSEATEEIPSKTVLMGENTLMPTMNDFIMENNMISVAFDGMTGALKSITNRTSGSCLNITQEYLFYLPSLGDQNSQQCDGAYIFRPIDQNPYQYNNDTPIVKFVTGPLSQYIIRYWSSSMIQTFRLYYNSEALEIEEVIGPIDISDGIGKEVISRYTTNLDTQNTWYTDSNGMEMQKRVLNYRPSWNFTVVQPTSGNYVPVNNIAYIQDTKAQSQFTVITDRSRGCASLDNGQIEFMLHRRTLQDDGRGVGEPLNETTQIITTSKLIFHDIQSAAQSHYRPLAQAVSNPYFPMFTTTSKSANVWSGMYTGVYSPLQFNLPTGLKIQSLQWLDDESDNILLRLQNIYQVDGQDNEDPQVIQVDIGSMFSYFNITSVTEMNLTGVKKFSNINRLKWNTNSEFDKYQTSHKSKESIEDSFVYSINPMDIKTFILNIQSN